MVKYPAQTADSVLRQQVVRAFLTLILLSAFIIIAGNAGVIAGDTAPEPETSPALDDQLTAQQAHIWYLLHCGYAVRTADKLLIFDYVDQLPWLRQQAPETRSLSNGWINPEEIKDLEVIVFVSHSHGDHFDPAILGWSDTIPNIKYFFGWSSDEIKEHNCLVAPRGMYLSDDLEVYTINSHHSGVPEVAYLVLTDSLAIYHGGDYNSEFKEDIAYLSQFVETIDIAFLNDHCGGPIAEPLKVFRPAVVLPGHFGGKEESPRKLPECVSDLNLPCEVLVPGKRGQRFSYDRGSE